jgi:hypothetical protein
MTLPRRTLALLLGLLVLPLMLFGALLGFGDRSARAQNVPILGSPNVNLLGTVPGTAAISAVFSRTAPYLYVSGVDSLTVLDVSDPKAPKLAGKLANAVFENEAMTLGERLGPDGKIQRFVLIGNDLANASAGPGGGSLGRIGGRELIVVDVTDPASPQIIGRTPSSGPDVATTSTHTVACMDAACGVAYTAGEEGRFSIIDLSDLTHPKQVGEAPSAAAGPNEVFTSGSGHHWNVDGVGIAWHTGSGGTAAFDVSDPRRPLALTATDAKGTETPYNDFIHHNSQRPNARAFSPGRTPSVVNGNVVLVTEEDYVNDGDEVACDKVGTFQTWELKDLDGAAYRARNPKLEADKGTMTPLDLINPVVEGGGGLSAPVGAFCSAHWFDYHQSGIVAQGYYQQGLRLIDVRDPKNLKQFGYFTAGATEVWDAYWAPERKADGTVTGRKTNIVYTVDAARGVDVYEVTNLPADLPVSGDDGGRGGFPAPVQALDATPGSGGTGGGTGSGPTGGTTTGTGTPGAKPCGTPESRFAQRSRPTRKRLSLSGLAVGKGCGITAVTVAVGRVVSAGRCRWLQENGRFSAPRSCLRTGYVQAKGRERWSLERRVALPRGRYVLWSRSVNAAGKVEPKARTRNLASRRVR